MHTVLAGSYREWAAGWSFGPCYLVDILPILALGAAEVIPRLSPRSRRALLAPLAWSVAVQFNGSFCYPASRWNPRMTPVGLERAAWSLRDFELWQDYQAWSAAVRR